MTAKRAFTSILGPMIVRYLSLKRALGRYYRGEQDVLQHLDLFLYTTGSDLTCETFIGWCHTGEHLTSGVRRKWMSIVRNFCLYRRRTEPSCFLPDPSQFPRAHQTAQPHIFTEDDIRRLLWVAGGLEPTPGSPLRSEVFRLAIVLLYTTGLRRGELLRLTIADYDPHERTLLIHESKFHKSRMLPLSSDGFAELDTYLQRRGSCGVAGSAHNGLLWNRYGGGGAYSGGGLSRGIRALFRAAGIRTASGRLPRVHDFRHTFAVHALLRWYQSGADLQTKLPSLATYMGHVSIVSTQYYLHFVEELAATASDRFALSYGALVTAPAIPGGVL